MSRTRCCIPFCNHSTGKPVSEWICGDHWRLIPRIQRRVFLRSRRRAVANGHWPPEAERLWRAVKRAAIERAMGI